jgi:micrococcal nuclease
LSICPIGSKARVDEDDGQNESYGRIVAVVYCEGINLNARMVTNEYVTIDERYCDVSEFADEDWSWKFC